MSGKGKLPLSVAVITLNEEDRLPDCLSSVSFAADLVVVDSGSSDRTVGIAREYGARVFEEAWRGFGPQKQFAIEQCLHDWVLVLDADERIPAETAAEIEEALRHPGHAAFSFPRKNYFMGRWMRHSGWWPDRVIRLFDKARCRMSANLVHESVSTAGSVGKMTNPIIHFTSKGLAQTVEKINRYSGAGAEELFRGGSKAGIGTAVLRGGWAFFSTYFIRLGFLDGSPGLVNAV